MADAAVPRDLFAQIHDNIADLRRQVAVQCRSQARGLALATTGNLRPESLKIAPCAMVERPNRLGAATNLRFTRPRAKIRLRKAASRCNLAPNQAHRDVHLGNVGLHFGTGDYRRDHGIGGGRYVQRRQAKSHLARGRTLTWQDW